MNLTDSSIPLRQSSDIKTWISTGKTPVCLQRVETRRPREHARALDRRHLPGGVCVCNGSTYLALVQQLRVLRPLRFQFHGHLLAVVDVHRQVDIAERAAADLTYKSVFRRGADIELSLCRRRRRLRPLGLLGHRYSRPPRRNAHLTSRAGPHRLRFGRARVVGSGVGSDCRGKGWNGRGMTADVTRMS